MVMSSVFMFHLNKDEFWRIKLSPFWTVSTLFFSLLEAINKEMSILIYIEKIMFFGFWKFEQSTLQRIYHEFSAGKTLNLLRIMKQTFPSQTLVWNFSTLLRKQTPRRDPNPPMGSAKLPTSTLICSSFRWFQLRKKCNQNAKTFPFPSGGRAAQEHISCG